MNKTAAMDAILATLKAAERTLSLYADNGDGEPEGTIFNNDPRPARDCHATVSRAIGVAERLLAEERGGDK